MTDADTPELLTVAEAAARLSVSERTIYRLLKSDNFAARTVTERRQTATGKRKTTLLPAALLAEIASEIAAAPNADNNAANNDGNGDRKPVNDDGVTVTNSVGADLPGSLPALLYQRQIAALEAQNAELKADKERLYGLLEQAQANLQREQSLRLLSAPTEPENAEAGEPSQQRDNKKGWWARLWGKA